MSLHKLEKVNKTEVNKFETEPLLVVKVAGTIDIVLDEVLNGRFIALPKKKRGTGRASGTLSAPDNIMKNRFGVMVTTPMLHGADTVDT